MASLKHLAARLRLSIDETLAQLALPTGSLPEAIQAGRDAFTRQLTTVCYLTGAAMVPALNGRASNDPSAVEKLLMRRIPRPSERALFVGDVVAHTSPLAAAAVQEQQESQNLLVRRIAAMAGDEMVSDEADAPSWRIPSGHCWVLADNVKLAAQEVIDSRSFGPLPLDRIIGRIIYQCQSAVEHSPVANSKEATWQDAAVLEAELDVEAFTNQEDSKGHEGQPPSSREE